MPRRIAILAALVCSPFVVEDGAEAEQRERFRRFASPPVALTSPLSSDRLHAGETVVLAWQALAELERYPRIEEWEAFLSLDDGERYPVRLTPHLDLEVRSIAVTLPQFAARRARLLLRFGDEEEELEYELPEEFELHPAVEPDFEPEHLARGRGEPARPGDPRDTGVAIWVEGTRAGKARHTVVAAGGGAGFDAVATADWIRLRVATHSPTPPQVNAAQPSTHPLPELFVAQSPSASSSPRAAGIEPRLSTCRRNE